MIPSWAVAGIPRRCPTAPPQCAGGPPHYPPHTHTPPGGLCWRDYAMAAPSDPGPHTTPPPPTPHRTRFPSSPTVAHLRPTPACADAACDDGRKDAYTAPCAAAPERACGNTPPAPPTTALPHPTTPHTYPPHLARHTPATCTPRTFLLHFQPFPTLPYPLLDLGGWVGASIRQTGILPLTASLPTSPPTRACLLRGASMGGDRQSVPFGKQRRRQALSPPRLHHHTA